MPPFEREAEPYDGMPYDDVLALRKKYVNPQVKVTTSKPILVRNAYKQYIWDASGKRYLDLFAGVVSLGVGHCHPKVVGAMVKQAHKYWHVSSYYLYPQLGEYAKKLADTLPGDLKVCYFLNTGGEAVDVALTMARVYSGTNEVITIKKGYHGVLSGLTGVTACSSVHYDIAQLHSTHNIMCPDVYRGVWGGKNCRDSPIQSDRDCNCKPGECQACERYLEQLEDEIQHSLPNKRAGIFMHETIQGYGGVIQYPKEYLRKAYAMIRARGGVCIADEVQNGYGRTGTHFWGFEGAGVVPDIVVTAKSIGNGIPFAAVITTEKIAQTMYKAAAHYSRFGGNPLALVSASAVLDVIKEEKLMENSHTVGTHFLTQLAKLRGEYAIVGDVRGKGLMIGVDLVSCKERRTPLDPTRGQWIMERLQDHGILIGLGGTAGNVMRLKPPMCVTKQDVDFAVAVLRNVLDEYQTKFK